MTTLEAIVGSTTYDLSDKISYVHLGNQGWGLAPVERLSESGPNQDGDTDLGFRLQPRIIQLLLLILSEEDWLTKRRLLARVFKPRNTAILLRFTNDEGDVYQIDTHYLNGLSFDSAAEKVGNGIQKVVISLKASNPLWYNPTQQLYTYQIGAGSSGFIFPIEFNIEFGGSTIDQTQTITYAGDYETSPIIEIHGPITNPVITNLTTGVTLDFTGTTIGDGDYYTVDTRYGSIAITEDDGTNRIDKLVGDSDLVNFKLISEPDSPNGQNDIQVTGTGANANTRLYVRYYERYITV